MLIAQSLFGMITLLLLAWLLSENRKAFPWRMVAIGLGMQVFIALLLTKVTFLKQLFLGLNDLLLVLQKATESGTSFVFGYLGGGALPFTESAPGSSFILAFQALPLILVISALSALLFHWRILPRIIQGISVVLRKTMGIGGALGVGSAANIFIGMVEAPLLIRPYLGRLTRSELFALMTCGMATIAGTVLVLYASIIGQKIPDALGHLLIASLISAPAALVIAAIMIPGGDMQTESETMTSDTGNAMDAITEGTLQGVQLLINIIAMLIVLVALVSLVNALLGFIPHGDMPAVTLQKLFGYMFAPLAWLIGIPLNEVIVAGELLGTKTVLNEFLAYLSLAQLPVDALSERSQLIMTYALCGFANFGSLGIMIGGLGTMARERRSEIVQLGLKSIIAGTLSTLMTGAVIGIIY